MSTSSEKIAITSPIPGTPTKAFLDALPSEQDFIVIDDSNGKIELPKRENIFLYDYAAQEKVLGPFYKDFIPFQKSAACRNLAHFFAYKNGYDYAVSLDYDCVVPEGFIDQHLAPFKASSLHGIGEGGWVNPLESDEWFSRGFPYSMRGSYMRGDYKTVQKNVILNMGLWKNVVDINGIDKVITKAPEEFKNRYPNTAVLGYVPLCGMNNMFKREAIPAYFFLPNFKIGNWEVSRIDDIWGGYIFEKLAEKKGDVITYGGPVVWHERESNQAKVLHYEHFMHILEPYFYELADAAAESVKAGSYLEMFAHFAENFSRELEKRNKNLPVDYFAGFSVLANAINLWKNLFQKL